MTKPFSIGYVLALAVASLPVWLAALITSDASLYLRIPVIFVAIVIAVQILARFPLRSIGERAVKFSYIIASTIGMIVFQEFKDLGIAGFNGSELFALTGLFGIVVTQLVAASINPKE